MRGLDLTRQSGLPLKQLEIPITVIGAGSIGSCLILQLSKMGFSSMTVFDGDKVEAHNVANQVYRLGDVGKNKVEATRQIAGDFSGAELQIKAERWKGQQLSGVVFVCVDSMKVRKEVWKKARYNPAMNLLIEGRTGGLVGFAYCLKPFDPDDIKFYEKTLYRDRDAEELPCTEQTIVFNVFGVSSMMCGMLASHLRNEQPPREISLDFVNFNFPERR